MEGTPRKTLAFAIVPLDPVTMAMQRNTRPMQRGSADHTLSISESPLSSWHKKTSPHGEVTSHEISDSRRHDSMQQESSARLTRTVPGDSIPAKTRRLCQTGLQVTSELMEADLSEFPCCRPSPPLTPARASPLAAKRRRRRHRCNNLFDCRADADCSCISILADANLLP